MDLPEIIRYRDLEPKWHVPGAKEPGFIRYLINWIGGPDGHINPNKEVARVSEKTVVGLMNLPVGQMQKGLHYHSVTEIYIILRGELESYDGKGQTHRAKALDCIYIPKGVPHGVRNCGTEDCDLIWVHDGIEKIGTSVYFMDGVVPASYEQPDDIYFVSFTDLKPFYGLYRGQEPEFQRWAISWVGGGDGFENYNRDVALASDKVTIGMTVLGPGQKSVPHRHEDGELYVVIKGKVVANVGNGNEECAKLDGVYFPERVLHGIRNHGDEPACLLWVQERPQRQTQCT
ncbi:Cupin domain-containing protein [Cladophialophora immunda]|nr:Cupin domain-containing protein [Cladophialophora immunda]